MLTLLDIAKQNGNDKIVGLIEEVNLIVPEVRIFPARTIKGTSFKTLVRTSFPTVGFRKANNGTDAVQSAYENRLVECALIDGRMEVDKAVADAAEDGAEVVKSREAVGYMGGAMAALAAQIWYGTKANDGFPGFTSLVDATMQIGNLAAGLTAVTGSSVFAVNLNELSGAAMVFGGNGQGLLGNAMEWRVESITGANSKKLTGYVTDLPAWLGLQVLSKYSVARLDNLTENTGAGLTDAWLAKLVNLFEEKNNGVRPTHLFCNYRSRQQLQLSRTVVLSGQGRGRPDQPVNAPLPTEYDGIPLIATTAISKTEAIVARS
jgi:hypothetical protein